MPLGYVGGSVLTRLFLARDSEEEVTVLIRATEKAEKLKQYGVIPVVGDLGDAQLVEKLVSEAEVVINAVSSVYRHPYLVLDEITGGLLEHRVY